MEKKQKKALTPEQLYTRNSHISKVLRIFSPIIFWGFLALTVFFIVLMIKNSVGNITEIIHLLNKKSQTGAELEQNYNYLVEKWGEWVIIGNGGGNMFNIRFVDIREAFFSGLMVTYMVLAIVSLVISIIVGKVLLKKLAQLYGEKNQDMVNRATLQTQAEITKIKEKDWF